MTTADDLLVRALEALDWGDFPVLVGEIRAYLDAPKDEPVAIVPREWRNMLQKVVFVVRCQTSNLAIQAVCSEADLLLSKPYLHPPTKTARAFVDAT